MRTKGAKDRKPRAKPYRLRSDVVQGLTLGQLLHLALDGVGYKSIAHSLGLAENTVSLIARKYGIHRYKRNKCQPQHSNGQQPRSPSSSTAKISNGSNPTSTTGPER